MKTNPFSGKRSSHLSKLAGLSVLIPVLLQTPLAAQTWTGGASTTDWKTAGNWNPATIPNGSGITAILGANATTINVASGGLALGTLNFSSAAANGITVNSATTFRINTAITVDAGNAYDNTLSTTQTLFLGNSSSGLTGNNTVSFTNNGTGLLTLGGSASILTAAAASDASVTLALLGTGSFKIDKALAQTSSTFLNTLGLTKNGTGTATLTSNANAYKGTTVINGGTLLVNGTHTGGAAYSVNTGGTLGGSGTIETAGNAGMTVASGGRLSPGSATTAGALTMNLGTGVLDISAAVSGSNTGALVFTLGSTSDSILLSNASSSLNIGTGALSFADFSFTAGAGFGEGTYTLFETSSSSGIAGTLGSDLTGLIGGKNATLSLGSNGSGNDVLLLTVVPEPGTVGSLLFGIALLGLSSRKRKNI